MFQAPKHCFAEFDAGEMKTYENTVGEKQYICFENFPQKPTPINFKSNLKLIYKIGAGGVRLIGSGRLTGCPAKTLKERVAVSFYLFFFFYGGFLFNKKDALLSTLPFFSSSVSSNIFMIQSTRPTMSQFRTKRIKLQN